MDLELIDWRDPRLRTPSVPFDFSAPQVDPLELSRALESKMREHRGLGLSAVQCGLNLRVFSMRTEPDATIFNPRIVDASEEVVELDEMCLSYPGMVVPVTRPRIIKLRFQVADGETRTLKLDGMTARVAQHEIDHLDGRTFFDHLSNLRLSRVIKRTAKTSKVNYQIGALRAGRE